MKICIMTFCYQSTTYKNDTIIYLFFLSFKCVGGGRRKGFIAIKRIIVGYPGFRIRGRVFLLHLMLVKTRAMRLPCIGLCVREKKNRHTHKGEQDKLDNEFAKIQLDIALKIHTLNNNY